MSIFIAKGRGFFVNSGLFITSFFIFVIVCELLLRFTHYSELLKDPPGLKPSFEESYQAGYDLRENLKSYIHNNGEAEFKLWTNELGCFDEPYNGETDFVLLVGDSFTHAVAPFEDKWGTLLEKQLDYRLLKCCVTGYGTKQEIIKTEKIISKVKKTPSLIIVGYFLNDVLDDYLFPGKTVFEGGLVYARVLGSRKTGEILEFSEKFFKSRYSNRSFKVRIWLTGNVIIYNMFKKSLGKFGIRSHSVKWIPKNVDPWDTVFQSEKEYPWLKKAWKNHLENLEDFQRLAMRYEARLLVVMIPDRFQVYDFMGSGLEGWFNENGLKFASLENPNVILRDFFDKKGIAYLDLLDDFREYANQTPRKKLDAEKDFYWRWDPHWNIKGNRLASLLVAEYILKNDFLDVENKEAKLASIEKQLTFFAKENVPGTRKTVLHPITVKSK